MFKRLKNGCRLSASIVVVLFVVVMQAEASQHDDMPWLSLLLSGNDGFSAVLKSGVVAISGDSAKDIGNMSSDSTGDRLLELPKELAESLYEGAVLYLPPGVNDNFPLGLAGRVKALGGGGGDTASVELTEVAYAEVFEQSEADLQDIPLTADNFVGVISPMAVQASSSATAMSKSALSKGQYSFRDGAVVVRNKTNAIAKDTTVDTHITSETVSLNMEIALENMGGVDASRMRPISAGATPKFVISGALDNISITNKHDFDITRGTNALKSLDLRLAGDLSFDVRFEGEGEVELGYFSQAWKEVDDQAIKKFGVKAKLSGLPSSDKQGKYPLAGLVWSVACPNTCPVLPGRTQTPVRQAKALGVIVWVYLTIDGELSLDGSLSLARLNPGSLSVGIEKPENGDMEIVRSLKPNNSGARLIEVAKIDGEVGLKIFSGVSVDLDFLASGVRFATAGADIGAQAEIDVNGSVGYGAYSLGSSWDWYGHACFSNSIGAGLIVRAAAAFGVEIDTAWKDVSGEFTYTWQYPSDEEMSEQGRHGLWYTAAGNFFCVSPQVNVVSTSISNGTATIVAEGYDLPSDMVLHEKNGRCSNIYRSFASDTQVIYICEGATLGEYQYSFSSSDHRLWYLSATGLSWPDSQNDSCDESHLYLCESEMECQGVGGVWSNNACNVGSVATVSSANQIWMDRNLGASRVATSLDDEEAFGDLYQWGRATDGHQKRYSQTREESSVEDSPGHGDFITSYQEPYDWKSSPNSNLWQGVSGTNNPCPSGFRLPTETELSVEVASWTNDNASGAFASPTKMVTGGIRNTGGSISGAGVDGRYWTSTTTSDGLYSRSLLFDGDDGSLMVMNARAVGLSVRCIQDSSPQETSTVTSAGGQVWMDRNLGASRVATSVDDTEAFGDLYQWGRGTDGHEKRTSWISEHLSSSNDPGHGSFIVDTAPGYSGDWLATPDETLWQDVAGINNPCPTGFRVPTIVELETERASWGSNDEAGAYASPLKLVLAGLRNPNNHMSTAVGWYWSSTVIDPMISGELMSFFLSIEDYASTDSATPRASGLSVRCIQD